MAFDPAFNMPTQFTPPTQDGWQGKEHQVLPRFYRAAQYKPAISQETGVPTSEPIDMIEIRQAGEKDSVKEIVNELHKRRWPQHWAAYQQGREQIQSGTPLELLFPGNPEVVEELKRSNVHTIQALVGIPDSSLNILPFLTDWKKKAEIFLKGTEKGKGFHELERSLAVAQHENRDLKARLDALEAKLAAPKEK